MLDICKNKFIQEGLPKGFPTFNQQFGFKTFFCKIDEQTWTIW